MLSPLCSRAMSAQTHDVKVYASARFLPRLKCKLCSGVGGYETVEQMRASFTGLRACTYSRCMQLHAHKFFSHVSPDMHSTNVWSGVFAVSHAIELLRAQKTYILSEFRNRLLSCLSAAPHIIHLPIPSILTIASVSCVSNPFVASHL